MKPRLFWCFFLFVTTLVRAQEIPEQQIAFVNRFKNAVTAHNKKAIYRLLDKQYRKEQKRFLGGNKQQLLDELFGGYQWEGDTFVVITIDTVQEIEIAEISVTENGFWEYVFRIRSGSHDITVPLLLVKKRKRYGFVGAVG